MIALAGYRLIETLRDDGELVLCRGYREGAPSSSLVLMPATTRIAPASLARLEHEYALRVALDPTFAVRPLALINSEGRTTLVLEDPGGELLERRLGTPMALLPLFLGIAIGIATALGRAHQKGLIHKDLKPANILVDAVAGEVRLTGFGMASCLPGERGALDPPEAIAGTLAYMAPEQTGRMNRSIDARSDLYALGIILYELLAGAHPFTAADPMEWVHCHVARQPVPLAERVAGLPEPVAAIVMKLLGKMPEDRYQSAAGVAADLRRCLAAWERGARVDPFALGARDARNRLRIPEALYGRAPQSRALAAAFEQVVAGGAVGLVLVSGYSGIGKSSLVGELHKAIALSRGLFLTAKFDQHKRDIPYATLAQAFRTLVRQILGKSAAEVERWRAAILEAVGGNGRLVLDLVPELAHLIGEQSPVPELSATEAQNRFHAVFRNFFAAFAQAEHPLVVFLDDLQWLDAASLKLLEYLITQPAIRHVLMIGAYRDNEIDPAHPLMLTLEAIRKAEVTIRDIVLTPLALGDVAALVADALHCEIAHAAPLAELVHEKTLGNPFFAIQFLITLRDEELLEFDAAAQSWQWDLPRIRAKGLTDNVVDLMVGKLQRLPAATREALQALACLGNGASIATLAMAHGRPAEATHADLADAVQAGFLLRLGEAYKFGHDRIQEAAYALIPEADRVALHLRIGRQLLAEMAPEAVEAAVFELLNQLNRGLALVGAGDERARLCRLNALAGRRAKAATAHAAARTYLALAVALAAPDAWRSDYAAIFALYLDLSECEYLVGSFGRADDLFGLILGRAVDDLDRGKVYSLRMRLYQVSGRYDDAIAAGREALRLFNVTFPEGADELRAAAADERREAVGNLGGRRIAELIDAPLATDPAVRAVIGLLVDAMPCAFIGRPPLFPLLALKALNFSLRHGNTEKSCYAYSAYGRLLVSLFGDVPAGYAFSELALRLNDRFGDATLKGTLLFVHGAFINHWRRPLATSVATLEEAFRACLEVGNLVYAGYCAFITVWQIAEQGQPLDEVIRVAARYASFARQNHSAVVYQRIRLCQQLAASLKGLTRAPGGLEDEGFDEAECLAVFTKANFGSGIAAFHILRQIAAFTAGRYSEALDAAERVAPVLATVMSSPVEATHRFYHALTLAALYPDAPPAERETLRAALADHLETLRLAAENCPENYRSRHALLAAEIAAIDGRELEAMRLFEAAIAAASADGFVQTEALAGELAGNFHLARGFATIGKAYLRDARHAYLRWGATGKVAQLDRLHPGLAERMPAGATATFGASAEQLDLMTVVKASQAVSGEIVLDRLIETLLTIVVEHAGAERGLLLLPDGEAHRIAAEAVTASDDVRVALRHAPASAAELPLAVLHYVRRTGESVILEDGAAPSPFADDPYIAGRRLKSVLCLPLVKQTQFVGALYLENNLAPGAFSADRIAILELLASQAAISLENARLYADLQEENGNRRRAEARVQRYADEVSDLYNKAPCGYHALDKDGRFVQINDTELGWLGRTREEVVGKLTLVDIISAESVASLEAALPRFAAEGALYDLELEFRRRDGSTMPVLLSATATEDAAGNTVMGRSTVYDIAERKQVEAARREREIAERLGESQKLAALGTLAGGVAHDFNNVLVPIIGMTKLTQRRLPEDSVERRNLDHVLAAADRAKSLVNQILAFSRSEAPVLEPRDIRPIIGESLQLLRASLPATIALDAVLPATIPRICSDATQLQQIIMNLCTNAAHAIGDGHGSIALRVEARHVPAETPAHGGMIAPGDYLALEIADDGAGMDEATLARAFEPFFTTKAVGKGTGLGLAVVHGIVKAHGGTIQVVSAPGIGTTFRLFFPLPARDAAQEARTAQPQPAEPVA